MLLMGRRAVLLYLSVFFLSYAQVASAFNVEEATIDSVHTAIKANKLTCVELVSAYLERIKKYNLSVTKRAPINAITEINRSVLDEARAIDDYYARTQQFVGPLHCVPVLLKDNIDAFDMTTTSGSYALLGNQPNQDAFLVARLRKAGAVMLAKTGMDEFAWGMFGISSRSGRIGNAYDPTKNPGGSSGGAAAGVSANFALLGVGTDNSGSIRIPAAFNGITGLRPSTGLISQRGIFPMGNLDGTAGPLARSTKDLAIMLDVIAQPDRLDQKTIPVPRVKSYLNFLTENGLNGKRIAVVRRVGKIDTFKNMPSDIKKVINQSLETMRQLGATITALDLPAFDNHREFNQAGEIQDVNAYLAAFPSVRRDFADICHSDRTRTFGSLKQCMRFINTMQKKNSPEYVAALKIVKKNKEYVHRLMRQQHLDALFMPISTHGDATYDGATVNTWRAAVSSNAGLPAIAINIGYSKDKMPIGIDLIGKQFDEGGLLAIAYAYEQRASARIVPVLQDENTELLMLSIPELNNLFARIGQHTYEQVLKNATSDVSLSSVLTPEVFQRIVGSALPD